MPKVSAPLKPFWTTTDGHHVKLYHGNVTDVLARLPAKSVHMVVTSPPYWGLRDYKTGTWIGGDENCDHVEVTADRAHKRSTLGPTAEQRAKGDLSREHPAENAAFKATVRQFAEQCGKCGANRIDQQIGSEDTPDEFVAKMVDVFRGVRRVLRDDGTVWLNLGDSYNGNGLTGVPWRVALALQADGWVLRQDIIWHKPSPMPESVRNRCTKAHEYVFLLAKSAKYFYDAEAIKEKCTEEQLKGLERKLEQAKDKGPNTLPKYKQNSAVEDPGTYTSNASPNAAWRNPEKIQRLMTGSNKRSVWSISSQGYEGAHFATFPPKLIEPMIKAGTSEKGCCSECGAPWKRVVEEKTIKVNPVANGTIAEWDRQSAENFVGSSGNQGLREGFQEKEQKTVGWEPTCECGAEVVPCTVLDCFIGSGTTCEVSIGLGRRSVGIDLSEKYLTKNAIPRIEGALMRRPSTSGLVARNVARPNTKICI